MSGPLVGFAGGYAFIVLAFAGLYYSLYKHDDLAALRASPKCVYADVAGTHFMTPEQSEMKPCGMTIGDFVFFSSNTIAPLGYSDIRPRDQLTQTATAAELVAGILWTVVVFGATLASVTEAHVKQMLADELKRIAARENEASPTAAGVTRDAAPRPPVA